jgi:hypothetical protein
MAEDKDGDGFKVPTKTGEVIPSIVLDADDNNPNVGSEAAKKIENPDTPGGDAGLEAISGYAIYDDKGQVTYADNSTELAMYINKLGAAKIKSLKQKYSSAGLYEGPVNGTLGTSDRLISLVADALNYQQIANTKLNLDGAVAAAIKADVDTGATSGSGGRTSGSMTARQSAAAEIQDTFRTMLGEPAPKSAVDAYYKELNALELSRIGKARNIKGVDVTTRGVAEQERIDLLNKYVNEYATIRIAAADAGDPVAQVNLGKGQFGIAYTSLKNAYFENGIPISQATLNKQVLESASNTDRLKANMNLINLQAKTIFPALTEKIDAGYTVKQLLSPYLQSRANILEEDADTIDIKELKDIAKDPKGLMNLYDYEVSLRQNPKWRFTKNAQDSMARVASKLAQTFGLAG